MVHSETETSIELEVISDTKHESNDFVIDACEQTTTVDSSKLSEIRKKPTTNDERCWSWLVLAVSLIGTSVVGCSYSLFSLLYKDFIDAFQSSSATAGWIGSMHVGCGNMAALFVGVAVERFGCRFVCMAGSVMASLGYFLTFFATHIVLIYFSYGLLAGIGMGMISMASVIATQQCFNQKRAFAGAVVTVGYSVGSIFSGLLIRYFYENSNWQNICVLFAGFILQMVVLAALAFRPTNLLQASKIRVQSEEHEARSKNTSNISEYIKVICEPSVWTFLVANCLVHIGVNTLYQHTPNRALGLGITPSQIALWPMTSALANMVAKLVGGVIANLPYVNRLLFYSASIFLSGIMQVLMPLCLDFNSIIIQGVVQNIFHGFFICVLTTILVDLKGVEDVAKTQALLALFVGTGVLVSTPFAGFLYDVTKNYDTTFIVTGIITLSGTIFSLLSSYFQKKNKKFLRN